MKSSLLAGTAILALGLLAAPVLAQGTPQTVALIKVDVTKLATG
ncbi:MAG: ABC transporter substrate-binding protein, partial [Betaproteobacteria bacterium]|nr:ABC transporter substrate-binding protein [Betaproteobacteria bacterium]